MGNGVLQSVRNSVTPSSSHFSRATVRALLGCCSCQESMLWYEFYTGCSSLSNIHLLQHGVVHRWHWLSAMVQVLHGLQGISSLAPGGPPPPVLFLWPWYTLLFLTLFFFFFWSPLWCFLVFSYIYFHKCISNFAGRVFSGLRWVSLELAVTGPGQHSTYPPLQPSCCQHLAPTPKTVLSIWISVEWLTRKYW